MCVCVYIYIYGLPWISAAVLRLSPAVAGRGHPPVAALRLLAAVTSPYSLGSREGGLSSRSMGAYCPVACGIFLDQGSNLRPLRWQAVS